MSSPRRPLVVFGFLGPNLDSGAGATRWDRWRPSVDLCRHDDLLVDRLELVSSRPFAKLARTVAEDARGASPETEVRIISASPPRIFDREVIRALSQWKFNPEPVGFIGEYEIEFKLTD